MAAKKKTTKPREETHNRIQGCAFRVLVQGKCVQAERVSIHSDNHILLVRYLRTDEGALDGLEVGKEINVFTAVKGGPAAHSWYGMIKFVEAGPIDFDLTDETALKVTYWVKVDALKYNGGRDDVTWGRGEENFTRVQETFSATGVDDITAAIKEAVDASKPDDA